MRHKTDATRQRILDAAYGSFWRLGFARPSMDSIAATAGVTKRTVYKYFRSKDDLLAAVLDHHAALASERLERMAARIPREPYGVIDSLFDQLSSWALRTPRWSGLGFTRLVFELGDMPGHPARMIARRVKAQIESWLAGLLKSAGVRNASRAAREVMLLMEGAMALMLIHGDRRYIEAAAKAAKRLVSRG
jgi:AcrR family transcriptional regulator